jgi:hypothetical protein
MLSSIFVSCMACLSLVLVCTVVVVADGGDSITAESAKKLYAKVNIFFV